MPSGRTIEELLLLRSLCAVLGTALVAVRDALGIESAADDVVTHAREVTDTAAADKNHGVLLKVMTYTRNVNGRLESVGKSYTGDLTERRVRLLRGGRGDLRANASLLGRADVGRSVGQSVETVLENRRLRLVGRLFASLLNELVKGWHTAPPLKIMKFVYPGRALHSAQI